MPFSMNAVVQERKVEKVGQASRWKPMAEPTPEMIASHQKCMMMTNTHNRPFPSFWAAADIPYCARVK